jgi:hypothetical protein
VTLTSPASQGNVILVSSEHAFPFGLTRKEIGFNLDNFSDLLYGVYSRNETCCAMAS